MKEIFLAFFHCSADGGEGGGKAGERIQIFKL